MSTSYSWSVVQLCLLCTLILINTTLLNADTLFSHDSDVVQLSANDFSSVIYGSSRLWMVDFYLSWCGACRRFAPVYSSLATSIKDWNSVIGLAAVSCSDLNNAALCRRYIGNGYPTVKLFPPAAAADHTGTLIEGHKTRSLLLDRLLAYLTRLLHEGRGHSSWPQLNFIRHTSELLSADSTDGRQVYIIVEDSGAVARHVGLMVILDLLPASSSVLVGRMRLEEVAPHGITERGLFTTTKFNTLYPVNSEFERNALAETIRRRVGLGSVQVTLTTTAASLAATRSPLATDGLHMQDIESGLYYSLWSEIPSRGTFHHRDLSALRAYIDVLAKYLPAEGHVVNYLNELSRWLKTTGRRLSAVDWISNINRLQTREAYIAHRLRWTGCHGSQPQYRGYPCSLWMILHALTVNAYLREINNATYSPVEVISAIRGYVEHFLGCRECAQNFGRGASNMLNGRRSARFLSQRDGAVIWLWKSHNRANHHLVGDITEDPAHPKVQFPQPAACPMCHHGSSWNETAVLQYLVDYYGAADIIDDDIDDRSDYRGSEVPVTTSGQCQVMSSDWTPCSRSCDVGTSVRLTNDNQDCRVETQVRLCLVRPCAVRFPDWTRSSWHVTNCARLGHTYQLAHPHTLQVGNCSTLTSQRWRVCGRCPSSPVTRRPICCRPASSTTSTVQLECPVSADQLPDDDTMRGDVMIEVIRFCSCDDQCLAGEM